MLPDGWVSRRIVDLAAKEPNSTVGGPFGSNLTTRDFRPIGVPVIKGENLGHGRWVTGEFSFVSRAKASELSANKAHPGDVLVTQRGTLGQVAVVPQRPFTEYVVSQSQMKVTVDDGQVDPLFLYYCLSSPQQQDHVRSQAIRTGVPHTNLGILRETRLAIPPRSEQQRIVDVLSQLDDKIELNYRVSETLEEMARALFESWFVGFDPVRKKQQGEIPKGMNPSTAALFPNGFQDSAAGELPTGWSTVKLESLLAVERGISYTGEGLGDTGRPMINLGCFGGAGRFRRSKLKHYVGEYKPKHLAAPGDLLVANTDITQQRVVLGSPLLVPSYVGECLFTHHVYRLRFKPEHQYLLLLVYYNLLQPAFRERAEGYATGTTVLSLPQDSILGTTITVPPRTLARIFNKIVGALRERGEAALFESSTLASIRDTLLPDLISGRVRVLPWAR